MSAAASATCASQVRESRAKTMVMAEASAITPLTVPLPDMAATQALGARLAQALRTGTCVALWGDLGAGKTTLARAILRGLGVTEDVPSPTFTIVQRYETPALVVHHYDLYRLKSAAEMTELGFDESLEDGAVLVEWPERAPDALPSDSVHVRLTLQDGARLAQISGPHHV